jgi:hypothetical protein
VNIEFTCPACDTRQQVTLSEGEGMTVPECSNPACDAEPAWGPITLTMMKDAVLTVAATHPSGTALYTAGFVLRLLNRVRRMPAGGEPEAASGWAAALDALARR